MGGGEDSFCFSVAKLSEMFKDGFVQENVPAANRVEAVIIHPVERESVAKSRRVKLMGGEDDLRGGVSFVSKFGVGE